MCNQNKNSNHFPHQKILNGLIINIHSIDLCGSQANIFFDKGNNLIICFRIDKKAIFVPLCGKN